MMREINQKGQSAMEYAILIAVIVAALVAMQIFVKRGASGKLKASSDQIGAQYDPMKVTSDFYTSSKSYSEETVEGGVTTVEIPETQEGETQPANYTQRYGSESIEGWRDDSQPNID